MRALPIAAAVALAAAAPRPAAALDPAGAATAAPAPDLRARPTEVVGLSGLTALAAPDAEVAERAASLRARRTGGIVAFAGAAVSFIAGGLLYSFAQADAAATNSVNAPYCSSASPCKQAEADLTPALVAYGVAAGLAIVGLAVWPRDREYEAAVGLWNTRHPAEPAEWAGWTPREPEPAAVPATP